VWKPLTGHAMLVYLGMGVTGWLSLLFLDRALHVMEPGAAAAFGFSHFIAEVVIVWVMSGVAPTKLRVLGCILIIAGLEVARRELVSPERRILGKWPQM